MPTFGRQLRGLGLVPDTNTRGDTWNGSDPALLKAAQADDIAGNGIFDGDGAPPTAHADAGVFQSHYSLPGYLYREQPTQPSEVLDATTGNPLVFYPNAGGSWYGDVRETYRTFDMETPRLYRGRPFFGPQRVPEVSLPNLNLAKPAQVRMQTDAKVPVQGLGQVTTDLAGWLEAYGKYVAGGALVGVALGLGVHLWRRHSRQY